MAIDFLIFALLIVSFVINLLALGAFWVTPGLRTTANRFTINLLIINLVGCLILAPTLFLSNPDYNRNGTNTISVSSLVYPTSSDDSIEIYSKPGNHQMTIRHNGKLIEQEGIIWQRNVSTNQSTDNHQSSDSRTIETIYKCNSTFCQELTIDEGTDTIVITEIEQQEEQQEQQHNWSLNEFPHKHLLTIRCWSIDMAAALGALAVLLVVGDTWCAITDPLRYHSRISGVKAWIFIGLTWIMGILFGALSAFRELDFESQTIMSSKSVPHQDMQQTSSGSFKTAYLSLSSTNNIFGMIFASLYFIIIILLPFGFVCGMYWRIFSEARENGLRMRQNGSSPLLQSALNLTHHQQQAISNLQYTNSLCIHRNSISSASSQGGGLQMQIDHRRSSPACLRRDSAAKILLPTISDDGISDDVDVESTTGQVMPSREHNERNQHILLTLQTASGEIKRNYSARQLPLLGTSSQDLRESHQLQGIRQVHSSPNLQKYTQMRQDSLSDESCSSHMLGGKQMHHVLISPQHRHIPLTQFHPRQAHILSHHHHSRSLQIPAAIHASPKALSYMSSLRHRLSNASSLFKYREENRAARISILVVIMFLVSYLPYGLLVLLQSRLAAANFQHSTQVAIFMILLGNLSSPFIFAYRNKRVRRGVKRLMCLEASNHDRTLHRQSNSSARGGGSLMQRHSSTSFLRSNSVNIKRNSTKMSTCSVTNLTPQNSIGSNGVAQNGVVPMSNPDGHAIVIGGPMTTLQLRPNSSCSTIINFSLNKHNGELDGETPQNDNDENLNAVIVEKAVRGVTIVEQTGQKSPTHSELTMPPTKFAAKRSLFKLFFKGSRNLKNCAAAQSCADGKADIEPTEV